MPTYSLTLVSQGAELVTLAGAKIHARIEASYTEEDALITSFIKAASEEVSSFCNRSFKQNTYRLDADVFEDGSEPVQINGLGLVTVTGVTYLPTTGGRIAFTDYTLCNTSSGVAITPNADWPAGTLVQITFLSGLSDIPERARLACMELVNSMWENREAYHLGNYRFEHNPAYQRLLWPLRERLGI
jgi:uncharacterized phiE125 gp8 family phage protein